jgi:hypothetical protein
VNTVKKVVFFVDLVKAYDTVNREMILYGRYSMEDTHALGVPESIIEVLKKLYTDVTVNLRVGEKLEQFLSTSGVKQGDNLAPVLFIFVIHAESNSPDKKWKFTTPDFRWYPDTKKLEANREDNYAEPSTPTRAQCSRSSSPIMSTIRPLYFSAAEK